MTIKDYKREFSKNIKNHTLEVQEVSSGYSVILDGHKMGPFSTVSMLDSYIYKLLGTSLLEKSYMGKKEVSPAFVNSFCDYIREGLSVDVEIREKDGKYVLGYNEPDLEKNKLSFRVLKRSDSLYSIYNALVIFEKGIRAAMYAWS